MIGSLVSSAVGIGASIFGGISASKAMKRVKQNVEAQQRKNEDWYNRNYNQDATQRADAQAILTQVKEQAKSRNRAAAGAQAVGGGTEESVAATKAANAQALAQAASNIAVNGEARKDTIEQQYMQTDSALQNQLNNLDMNQAQTISQAASAVGNIGAAL